MATMAALADPFNQNTLNGTLWASSAAGSATLSYSSAGAVCTFPGSSTSSTIGQVNSQASYDLTGSYAWMQVLAVPSAGTHADADMRLYQTSNAAFYVRWVYEAGTLFAQYRAGGGNVTVTSFAYSGTTHKWWRIRESGGTTFWDTAPDGITWTNRASHANPVTLTALTAYVSGSCFQAETSPGTFQWNNFNTPVVVNQWSGTFSQPAAFGTTPPALESVVVPLTSGTSVGGGSGTPAAGNWLFALVAMNEPAATAGFTVGVGDDIHSFWRPGNEQGSTWAVSAGSALTRTAIWYTANTSAAAGNVYVAPNGSFDALAVLVIEVAGLQPWDTVAGIFTNYAAAATSLSLSLSAPSALAFILGATGGDNTANGQAFAPSGWTALHTVTSTNGTDHTSDAELTSACLNTTGSVSVTGTASSATDLSGVLIAVLQNAPSPVPAAGNPNWPYLKFEAALGAGFQDPQDTLTWTDLSARLWAWDETTGIQYQLGSIQATDLEMELDNFDALLSSDNPASVFYTHAGWAPQAAFYDNLVSAAPPLAWWKLADAAGTTTITDSSGNSHTGTATSVTFGNANEAVTGNTSASFASASSSHVLTSYNPALSAVTVEAWVNLNSLSQASTPRILANSVPSSDSKGFELALSGAGSNVPQVRFGNTSTFATVAAGAALPASGWTYLAATWDGTTVTLYVNGVAQGTAALSGPMPAGTASGIGIGYNPVTPGNYANGLLAECAIYGAALTAGQVAARYTAGPGVTGTPLRIRAALGVIGGVTVNRWYVISRNMQEWPQQVDPAYRRYVTGTATDIWSVLSASGPAPYRGEVRQDSPYAWWPCDDQPLAGGVLPASLRNAALGNTNVLNITLAPGGTLNSTPYTNAGSAATSYFTPFVASYTAAAQQGWLYGDPQASPQSYATPNPVTQNPGSAAWEQTGCQGPNGNRGWWLSCNDAGFPPLSAGVCVEGWFNWLPYGSNVADGNTGANIAQQPKGALTLLTLATGSLPVAILQLDSSGHLNLVTYNGSTPTTHAVYSATDLRNQGWFHVAVNLTTTTWSVYLNGGVTAIASGSGVNMTSAWTYLLANADMGANGGGSTANLAHVGDVSAAHLAVYPAQLAAWRILGHYCAGMTGFGSLPAPQAVTLANIDAALVTFFLEGTATGGAGYGGGTTGYSFSARIVSVVGSYTSGPSAYSVSGYTGPAAIQGDNIQVTWTGQGERFNVYTATQAGSETQAEVTASGFACFTGGYGGSAASAGVNKISGGSGASPPAAASALGDTVAQRLERILGYGRVTYPGRCIDPASLAVQAATDIGGQQAGANLSNIAQSDGGLLYVDSQGNLTYWQKSHLAAQYSSPVWTLTPAAPPMPGAPATAIPYYREGFRWLADPQRVWNAITIPPFSPDGASLADITPSNATAANASQQQYGAQPHQVTSYLQSTTEMQSQADWLLSNFGQAQIRVEGVKIDAAPYPAAWPLVLGINVGDVVTCANWQIGGGGIVGTFRVSNIKRRIVFGDDREPTEASVTLQLDFEAPSYWS